MGRLQVRSQLTWNEAATSYVVIHYGGLDFHAVLRPALPEAEHRQFQQRLFETYRTGSLAEVTRLVLHEFQGEAHRLDDLFLEEQRRIIQIVLQDRFEEYQRSFEQLADQDEDVLAILSRLNYPIPKAMLAAASVCLDGRLRSEIARLATDGDPRRILLLLERGRTWGYHPERETLRNLLAREMQAAVAQIHPQADFPALAERVGRLLDVAAALGVSIDLWRAQNCLLDTYGAIGAVAMPEVKLREAFARLAERLHMNAGLLGWKP
jgi:hypothetical protein